MNQKNNPFTQKNILTVKKKELIDYIKKAQTKGEISWVVTNQKTFDWIDANEDKDKFLKQLANMPIKTACVGIHFPDKEKTKYNSFEIIDA